MSAAKSMDSIKYTATHMNMKLPPNQLKTRKGRETLLNLIKTYMDNDGYHIQFNVLDTATPEGRTEAPGEVPRSRRAGGRLQRVLHQAAPGRAERDHRPHRAILRQLLNSTRPARRGTVPRRVGNLPQDFQSKFVRQRI